MSLPLSDRMIALLVEHRESLNTKFRLQALQGKGLDERSWLNHVQDRLAPIVDAVEVQFPERAKATLLELYDLSLTLFATGHFGEEQHALPLLRLWQDVLPALGALIARDPRRIVGSLCNAALQIERANPNAVDGWLSVMQSLGPQTKTVEELLALGKVAAWRVGLPHYRIPALSIAARLPPPLLCSLLEPIRELTDSNVMQSLKQMELNPWCLQSALSGGAIRQVSVCGAFRGYGGVFLAPPTIAISDGALCAFDKTHAWQLYADAFGCGFQRIEIKEKEARSKRPAADPKVSPDGTIAWGDESLKRRDLADCTSSAFDGQTLAITIPTSFQVYLFARFTSEEKV